MTVPPRFTPGDASAFLTRNGTLTRIVAPTRGTIEVEGVLFEHPAVTEAAVIGIPHPVLGEEVGAVVQLRAGAIVTEEELQAHVADRLAAFKVPVRFWFRDEPLPRNPAGKVMKRDLRQELLPSE